MGGPFVCLMFSFQSDEIIKFGCGYISVWTKKKEKKKKKKKEKEYNNWGI